MVEDQERRVDSSSLVPPLHSRSVACSLDHHYGYSLLLLVLPHGYCTAPRPLSLNVRPPLSAPSALLTYTLTSLADHFDTHHYVTRLESHGLKREQAEGVVDTLEDVIRESVESMQLGLVTREEQDKVRCSLLTSSLLVLTPYTRSTTTNRRRVPSLLLLLAVPPSNTLLCRSTSHH